MPPSHRLVTLRVVCIYLNVSNDRLMMNKTLLASAICMAFSFPAFAAEPEAPALADGGSEMAAAAAGPVPTETRATRADRAKAHNAATY
eukprot:gene44100-54801_t